MNYVPKDIFLFEILPVNDSEADTSDEHYDEDDVPSVIRRNARRRKENGSSTTVIIPDEEALPIEFIDKFVQYVVTEKGHSFSSTKIFCEQGQF